MTRVGASEGGLRTSFNRTREAGNRDEVEGVVANALDLFPQCGQSACESFRSCFIVWLALPRRRIPGALDQQPDYCRHACERASE